ncbi:MAG: transglycosylase SLT domain-containing protein [Deltaproteobacteria bacterium]|nr:transglycosylase SLT domain-containing protein [Deltaproteobacteria bacterium]
MERMLCILWIGLLAGEPEPESADWFAPILIHSESQAAVRLFARRAFAKAAERADHTLREERLGEVERNALGFIRALARLESGLEPDPADWMRVMNSSDPPGLGDHAAWFFGQHLWKTGRSAGDAKAFELAEPYLRRVSLQGRYGMDARLLLIRGSLSTGQVDRALRWAEELAAQRFRHPGESQALLARARCLERLGWMHARARERERARTDLRAASGLYKTIAALWSDRWAGPPASEGLARLVKAGYRPVLDLDALLARARAITDRPHGMRDLTHLWRIRSLLCGDAKSVRCAEADLLWAELSMRYRRYRYAWRTLSRVRKRAPLPGLKARAGLLIARLTSRRRPRQAIGAYLEVAKTWPDSDSAAPALYRAGELARRYGQPELGRKTFARCVERYPDSSAACRWGLAWMEYRAGEPDTALAHLEPLEKLGQGGEEPEVEVEIDIEIDGDDPGTEDELDPEGEPGAEEEDGPEGAPAEERPDSDELALFDLGARRLRERALYWRARILEQQRKLEPAAEAYRQLMEERPFSFYALLGWERLAALGLDDGVLSRARKAAAAPPPAPETLHPEVGAAWSYLRMGLEQRARSSLAWLRSDHLTEAVDRRMASRLWEQLGEHRRSHRLAPVPREGGLPGFASPGWQTDARLGYPRAFREQVESQARDTRVPSAMLYALIRVESGFWARARSPAGARGLTQVVTRTGHWVARKLGLKGFRRWKLYEPEVAVQVGSAYLGLLIERFSHPALALAAYNAGEGAVARWLQRRGDIALDAFIEEIPFAETARYVRRSLTYFAIYRALYEPGIARPLDMDLTQPASIPKKVPERPSPPARGQKKTK